MQLVIACLTQRLANDQINDVKVVDLLTVMGSQITYYGKLAVAETNSDRTNIL